MIRTRSTVPALAAAGAAVLALSAVPAAAQGNDAAFRATTFNLSASGETAIAPDMATITLGVQTEGASAAAALSANGTAMNKVIAAQCQEQATIDVHGRDWILKRAGQRNADVGVFRFTRPIDHAAHNRQLQLFNAWIFLAPYRHGLTHMTLNLLRQFLKEGAGGAAATGACRHLRRKAANVERLENLLRG